jgi:predicted GNAT family acetyltransferase
MTDPAAGLEVEHEAGRNRFVVRSAGQEAVLDYQDLAEKIVFTHTGVPGALEGRGIGAALARAGLEWARASGKRVVPICPFVAAYVARHPEYADLVRRGGEA